ncbi:hypothetical protein KFK09_000662 [Dendrobium nobile]|uniref:Uncharacterized protein n=1 Tax=Dendrobium nobile TaxID=94219 RepID=A0A8T3CFJ7_DENNO|nr:hypothetical protein KFK09_000662 [Dendrobium nobile]
MSDQKGSLSMRRNWRSGSDEIGLNVGCENVIMQVWEFWRTEDFGDRRIWGVSHVANLDS